MKIFLRDLLSKKNIIPDEEIDIFIKAGKVLVNDVVNRFPFDKIDVNSTIRIKDDKEWVSRGAYKLLEGLEQFNINVKNLVCIDIGSSTGGFTDILLSKGAKKVYCVDSGHNQLDYKLRNNHKTIIMEKTNLKFLNRKMFDEIIDFIVADVSFISLGHVFSVCKFLLEKGSNLLVLIKPEFEANSNLVKKGGYVDEIHHQKIIDKIIKFALAKNFKNINTIKSPILGKKSKNIEYLSLFRYF